MAKKVKSKNPFKSDILKTGGKLVKNKKKRNKRKRG